MNQSQALDMLKTGRNVYLTGAAGSGKTHVLRQYIEYLRDRGVGVAITASTGIAATHIGGMTIHSWSGVGVRDELTEEDVDNLIQKKYLYKRFEKAKVLIIDEVSMLSPQLFDSVDRICQSMKQDIQPFGGMQIVLSGDFFQLPPISRGRSDVRFINSSNAWQETDIRVCYLTDQYRHDDNTLEGILGCMRTGEVDAKSRKTLLACNEKSFKSKTVPTRLFTHNVDVDELNDQELDKIDEDEEEYKMTAVGKDNMVDALMRGVLVPETLRLKKGAAVMFVKNNFDEGYVNGTLGTVEDFDDGIPVIRTFSGGQIYAHNAEWTIEEDGKILAKIEQIPLRLAWAITIHKSQGMSLDAASIDLSKAFVPGQGYVALSRLRKLSGLILLGINDMAFAVHPDVLKLDREFIKKSDYWVKRIEGIDKDEMRTMQDSFIIRSGGTLEKREIEENQRTKDSKVSTHEVTRSLLERELSLKEIAKERGLTTGTILSHIEKLRKKKTELDITYLEPDGDALEEIKVAFTDSGDTKLAPVARLLKNKYTYEELRLARLFL
ncbi:MAG: AAA family ATPase [bacterium]|nr:AAA family ATPase [bacterium]